MKLFSPAQIRKIKEVADKSKAAFEPPSKSSKARTMNQDIERISKEVEEYFKDSPAILITTKEELHQYILDMIECGIGGVDCETTGLDRIHDHVVGFSLYCETRPECYIPNRHLIPLFDQPYANQLTYEEVHDELLYLLDSNVKLVYANADFDLAMMRADFGVDLSPRFFYDVILAWRCMKENEPDNRLKILYNKYCLKGRGDPKTFSDLFPVAIFPYCKPNVAKLYAANDSKLNIELMRWQLPYCDKDDNKCKKNNLEAIADLIWNLEMPLVKVCHGLHHTGIHLDRQVAAVIRDRYRGKYEVQIKKLHSMVQEAIDKSGYIPSFSENPPFRQGDQFNPDSNPQVKHLITKILKLPLSKDGGTDKDYLSTLSNPVLDQILVVRSLKTLIGTFTDKLIDIVAPDSRIHATFKQIGADTGRFSSADPNMQNIPSHNVDIRHMFRATPEGRKKYKLKNVPVLEGKCLELSVPNYYSFYTDDGLVKVSDAAEGLRVNVIRDDVKDSLEITSIRDSKSDIASLDIRFHFDSSTCIDVNAKSWDIWIYTPRYIMMSSDYSAQEPRLTAYVSNDSTMIESFKAGRDIYATVASVAFGYPYEKCLEFHPETGEYQPDGKQRRSESKSVLLGICYGRSVSSVADQLYGHDDTLSDKEKVDKAQKVFDSVLTAIPGLRDVMNYSQQFAKKYGYVETILGRRRHIPDMQLPEFTFVPMEGYINPDIDPLDPSTLDNEGGIPKRIQESLLKEFSELEYFGQIVKRSKKLAEEYKIKVINNRPKINDARRQALNSRIQGSAADQTKMAMLLIDNCERWHRLGARLLIPVHDELIAEAPVDNYEEAGELLSSLMCEAASFLPFESKCDVETTLRWYGLEYPCPFSKPEPINSFSEESMKELSDNDISWIQYCLTECEYQLPVYKNPDGSKPNGIAAKGVNGVPSEYLLTCIVNYIEKYGITESQFLDHIEHLVFDGTLENNRRYE